MADEPIGRAQAFRHRRSGMDGDAGPAAEPIPAVPSPRTPDRRGAVGVPVGGGGGEAFADAGSATAGRVEIRRSVLAGGFDCAGGDGGESAGSIDAGGFAGDDARWARV